MTALEKRKVCKPRTIFDELFDDGFENMFSLVPRRAMGELERQKNWTWNPRVDVRETEQSLIFDAELPGMSEEDVDITLEDNRLTIKGERKLVKKEEKENYHRMERMYGSFQRSYTLPSNVNTENVDAKFENGILQIKFAKQEEAKPKRIEISPSL